MPQHSQPIKHKKTNLFCLFLLSGFNFAVSGPYQEFPILQNGNVYTGGSPGADRVVFNTNGAYAGAITHTGASGNNFVGCSGTSL